MSGHSPRSLLHIPPTNPPRRLVSPYSAGNCVGRARVVSRQRVLFLFLFQKYTMRLFVRIDIYQSRPMCTRKIVD